MATIVTINSGDLISNSRADLNTNFTNLNSDKIETSYIDTDTALAANSDTKIPSQKAVKVYIDTSGGANASETVRGIVEEATDAEVTAGTATGGTGAKLIVTPAKLATRISSLVKFGGTGADGALTITSGATNIDLAGATVVVKNYTSISITGTGSLTFTNPASNGTVVVLKSQGAVTLTSSTAPMIDCSGLGGAGADGQGSANSDGSVGTVGKIPGLTPLSNPGLAGTGGPVQGAGGAIGDDTKYFSPPNVSLLKYSFGFVGGGGGSARTGAGGTSGTGGRGGGMLIIECAGAWNFTTSSGISVAGKSPAASTATASGSGAGSGGFFMALVASITANTGTINVSGGTGGSHQGVTTIGGGGAGSPVAAGDASDGSLGGDGAVGYSMGANLNTEFL